MNNKHEFALYYSDTHKLKANTSIEVNEAELVHRLSHVLRLDTDEVITLFDSTVHVRAKIVAYKGKKSISLFIEQYIKNHTITPDIICLLPLIKRQAFDESLYALAQMGVMKIQPILAHKSARGWGTDKDFERAKNIFIAAAEQSKQFILPEISSVLTLQEAISLYANGSKIFFDAEGQSAWSVIDAIRQKKAQQIVLCFGPEGDLTEAEKTLLKDNKYAFCALTQSILKSEQAIALACGMLRSCLR